MPHTFTSNFLHIVFSTKERRPFIRPGLREKLWAYIQGIAQNHDVPLLAIGGTEDHVHVLIVIPARMSLSDVVSKLKANSSRFMRRSTPGFTWQEGYGAFSVSPSQLLPVKRYIRHQAAHHAKRDFAQEFVAMLRMAGVSFDPHHVMG